MSTGLRPVPWRTASAHNPHFLTLVSAPSQELEALDKRIAGVGSGPEEDYLSHWSRLITKYGISTPKIQVWASMELRRL